MRPSVSAPTEPPPSPTPFDLIGGRDAIRRLSDRFYDRIDRDPAFAELRALHAPDLAGTRASLTDFLTAWLGGPRTWFEDRPRTCIMSMHRAIPTTTATADQWLAAMDASLALERVGEPLRDTILQGLTRMARHMAFHGAV